MCCIRAYFALWSLFCKIGKIYKFVPVTFLSSNMCYRDITMTGMDSTGFSMNFSLSWSNQGQVYCLILVQCVIFLIALNWKVYDVKQWSFLKVGEIHFHYICSGIVLTFLSCLSWGLWLETCVIKYYQGAVNLVS